MIKFTYNKRKYLIIEPTPAELSKGQDYTLYSCTRDYKGRCPFINLKKYQVLKERSDPLIMAIEQAYQNYLDKQEKAKIRKQEETKAKVEDLNNKNKT